MKILYGVQGTGNGHISRARLMAKHFANRGVEVDYLFSGREPGAYFDMQVFGDYQLRRGLTFSNGNGKVSYLKTAVKNNIAKFAADVFSLSVDEYDLVITDFEPVTSWAARVRRKSLLGIGHQYAFGGNAPLAGGDWIAKKVMQLFAPTPTALGLHWERYDPTTLPPIIDHQLALDEDNREKKIVVYLPFECQHKVQEFLAGFIDYKFVIYSPDSETHDSGNISLRKTSHDAFKLDLKTCIGVICNSGFELASECVHLGLSILTKPLHNQMEQLSNAAALNKLGYATVMDELNKSKLDQWLNSLSTPIKRQPYPDVANAIVDWILDREKIPITELSYSLWQKMSATGHLSAEKHQAELQVWGQSKNFIPDSLA